MDNITLFKSWYSELLTATEVHGFDETTHGQLMMISNVLRVMLPRNEYNRLVRRVNTNSKTSKLNTRLL